jgi:hypothetical protein
MQEVLQHLGYTMKPLYVTKHFSEPGMRDYYTNRVYIRVPLIDTNGWRNRSSHHNTAHFSTDEAAVNDAPRSALWSLCNAQRDRLHGSEFRHIPRRVSGSEETIVPAGRDDRIDILTRVTAALNTDLEGATAKLDRYHEELQTADCSSCSSGSTTCWSAAPTGSNAVPNDNLSTQEAPLRNTRSDDLSCLGS